MAHTSLKSTNIFEGKSVLRQADKQVQPKSDQQKALEEYLNKYQGGGGVRHTVHNGLIGSRATYVRKRDWHRQGGQAQEEEEEGQARHGPYWRANSGFGLERVPGSP